MPWLCVSLGSTVDRQSSNCQCGAQKLSLWLCEARRCPPGGLAPPLFLLPQAKSESLVGGGGSDVSLTQLDHAQMGVKSAARSEVWGQGRRAEGRAGATSFPSLQGPHLLHSRYSQCTVDSFGPIGICLHNPQPNTGRFKLSMGRIEWPSF